MHLRSGGKCTLRILASLLALVAAIAFHPSLGTAQNGSKKLSKQDVIDFLTGDVSSADVAQEARKDGISFQVTPAVESEIRAAGGTDDLIQVLRSLAPRTTPVTPPPSNPPSNPTTPTAAAAGLLIDAHPGQSEVYIDDEPVGTTSQGGRLKLTRLTPGEHRVRVSLNGYQDYEETVTLKSGAVVNVSTTLQKVETPPLSPPIQNPQPETPSPVTSGQPGYLGVLPMEQQPAGARGVVLSGAQPGGPAEQVGLKTYDTILAVNGQQVTTPQALRQTLSSHQAGEVVQITWYNGSTTVTRPVRLANWPAQAPTTTPPQVQPSVQPQVQPQNPSLTRMPHNGYVNFAVAHDHGQSGQNYCVGIMTIGNGMIYYKATNGVHNFEIPLNSVREAKRNTVYLVGFGAFHIRTKKNSNFNFVALNQQGKPDAPDAVLTAIDNAMGQ